MSDANLPSHSDLVGAIYDSALDPGAWHSTLQRICLAVNGHSAGIVLLDFKGRNDRLVRDWGPSMDWGQRIAPVLDSVKHIHRQFLGISGSRLDEPILLPRDLSPNIDVFSTPFYCEWAAPQGIHQVLEAVALSETTRLGLFCITRQDHTGDFTDEQVSLIRSLSPHIRRAITISDLLDLRTVERNAFAAVVDSIPSGVCVVGHEGQILHANTAALAMLEGQSPVRSVNGRLRAEAATETTALIEAIAAAQTDEVRSPGGGIAVPLRAADGSVSVAYVLPLAKGNFRTRLVPQALAAVFINTSAPASFGDIGGVASSFEFTPSETRLAHQLMLGLSIADAADQLGVTENTAKTHLKNIFYKTGVSRQVDLVTLLLRLVSPALQRG